MEITKYFLLGGKNTKHGTSAFAPTDKVSYEVIPQLEGLNEFPFEFNLIKLTIEKNGIEKSNDLSDLKDIWLDYQPNSLAFALFSTKLKDIVNQELTGNESLDWISAKINGNGEQRIYYVPRFNKALDILDIEKTMFVQGTARVLRPTFSLSKIIGYSAFYVPWSGVDILQKISNGICVNERLKNIIQKEKFKGIAFDELRVE